MAIAASSYSDRQIKPTVLAMDQSTVDQGESQPLSQETAGTYGTLPVRSLRRSTVARGRGRGKAVARTATGRFMRALPVEDGSLADMDSVSALLALGSPAVHAAEPNQTIEAPGVDGLTSSSSLTATPDSIPVARGSPKMPSSDDTMPDAMEDIILSSPPATPTASQPPSDEPAPKENASLSTPHQPNAPCSEESTATVDRPAADQTQDATGDQNRPAELPVLTAETSTAQSPCPTSTPGPATSCLDAKRDPTTPAQATPAIATPGSKDNASTHDQKENQKRRHSLSDSLTSRCSSNKSSPLQGKKPAKKRTKPGPIDSPRSPVAGPSTAPVQPGQFFGSATLDEFGQSDASAHQQRTEYANTALPGIVAHDHRPIASSSSGQPEGDGLSHTQNPFQVTAPLAQPQQQPGWGVLQPNLEFPQDVGSTLGHLPWGQHVGQQPHAGFFGAGGLGAPFTAPPVVNAGTFAQQQALAPVMNNGVPTFPTVAGFGVFPAAGWSQMPQYAMPQTANPILQGQGFAQWQAQPVYGTHYLPSYTDMANDSAMRSNPNLSPWNSFAAHHAANSSHDQGSSSAGQSSTPSSDELAQAPAAGVNPPPTYQHNGAQSTQALNASTEANLLDDPEVKAALEYLETIPPEEFARLVAGLTGSIPNQQADGTEQASTEVEAQ